MMFRVGKPVLLQGKVHSPDNFFSVALQLLKKGKTGNGGRQVNSRIRKRKRFLQSVIIQEKHTPEMMPYAKYLYFVEIFKEKRENQARNTSTLPAATRYKDKQLS